MSSSKEGGITITIKDTTTKEINKIERTAQRKGYEVAPLFEDIKRELEREMIHYSLKITDEARNALKTGVPYDNSITRDYDRKKEQHKGHLRDNITSSFYNKGRYTVEIFVGWQREYGKIAQLVNDGASGHRIEEINVSALKFPTPTSPNTTRGTEGYKYVKGGVFHPGFEGRHFIDNAKQVVETKIDTLFDTKVGD